MSPLSKKRSRWQGLLYPFWGMMLVVGFCGIVRYTPFGRWLEEATFSATESLVLHAVHAKDAVYTSCRSWAPDFGGAQLAALRTENAVLKQKLVALEVLESRQHTLEKILHVVRPWTSRFVTAPLITRPLRGWNTMFFIQAGHVQGIRRGQPVVSVYGVVGRIDYVGHDVSRVMPLTHVKSRIPVMGLHRRQQAILVGNGSACPALIYEQAATPPTQDEFFVTSVYGAGFPEGHLVGRLQVSTCEPPRLKLLIPWRTLDYVQVLIDFPKHKSQELLGSCAPDSLCEATCP